MLNRAWRNLALFACLLAFSFPRLAQGQQKLGPAYKVGIAFRSFVPKEPYNWRGAKTQALLTTVWYPAASSAVEKPVQVPGMSQLFVTGRAAQDAGLAPSPAKFPLIVLSHGTGGSALQMAWLGHELAAHGYIAAAINHPGNNGTEAYTALGFSTWWERARDLSTVIDNMLSDSTFGGPKDSAALMYRWQWGGPRRDPREDRGPG